MAELSLTELVAGGVAAKIVGDPSVRVRGVKHDSRRVEPGDLFVAVPGGKEDGVCYARAAIDRGAVAVLCERELSVPVPVLIATDALVGLSRAATLLCDDPTRRLSVVGITGTNGKTTTAYLVEAILRDCGARPAVIGTVGFRSPKGVLPATHTTPMADDLMRLSRWALDGGATHLVLEVSSHGLAMHRVDGVRFAVAAFTNLTQDHLDYHGDMASYERAKRRLFAELAPAASVVNVDDPAGAAIARAARGRVLRCSAAGRDDAEIRARDFRSDRDGLRATVATPAGEIELRSPLLGAHNLENLLVALGCALALGYPLPAVAAALRAAPGAPGRLQRVAHPKDVLVFVDYAHTPDALERVLCAVRDNTQHGRLITVFGCGGDRDPGKRPLMGEVAARRADLVVLTSDNPRSEEPAAILSAIEAGVAPHMPRLAPTALPARGRGYLVEADRRAAIRVALAAARAGDSVVIAGKGHEKVQIVGDRRLPFDDCVEAERAIAETAGVG